MDVLAQLQCSTSAAGDENWQVVVLMRGAIAHAGSERKDRVVEQRGAVRFLDVVHPLEQSRKCEDVEAVQL